jgi:hypothetical protein
LTMMTPMPCCETPRAATAGLSTFPKKCSGGL